MSARDNPYARLSLTESELTTVRSCVRVSRDVAFSRWGDSPQGPQREFYSGRIDMLDALIAKLEKPFADDKSQDAEDDEEDAEDDS